MNLLTEYLKQPHVNISGQSKATGVNDQQVHQIVKGLRPMPSALAWSLTAQRCPYAVGGWWLEKDGGEIFVSRPLDGQEPEVIDHENWFEYRVSMSKDILADEFDLIGFLEKK